MFTFSKIIVLDGHRSILQDMEPVRRHIHLCLTQIAPYMQGAENAVMLHGSIIEITVYIYGVANPRGETVDPYLF